MYESVTVTRMKIRSLLQDVLEKEGTEKFLNTLCQTIHAMGVIALDDPDNRAKDRQFRLWSQVGKKFLESLPQVNPRTFEELVTDAGRSAVHGLGIRLD